jgi:N-acetylglucosamine malate deacetylase 2
MDRLAATPAAGDMTGDLRGGRMTAKSATTSPSPRTTASGALPAAVSVLAVTARPGQESADLGGILQVFRRSGASLSLLCMTRGEATPAGLGAARAEAVRPWEVQMAAAILGVRAVTVANYRDGALHRHRPAELTERIGHAISEHAADMVVVVAPEAGDSEDLAVAQATSAAAARAGVPLVSRTRHDAPASWPVPLGESVEIIRAIQHSAVAVHASQPDLLTAVLERLDLLEDTESLRWLRCPRRVPAQGYRKYIVAG